MNKLPCVYILTNKPDGTLYVGVTSNLVQRIWQHKAKLVEGFTKKYNLEILVWYETADSMISAIEREKTIKSWKRQWKIELIEQINPQWNDLYCSIC